MKYNFKQCDEFMNICKKLAHHLDLINELEESTETTSQQKKEIALYKLELEIHFKSLVMLTNAVHKDFDNKCHILYKQNPKLKRIDFEVIEKYKAIKNKINTKVTLKQDK